MFWIGITFILIIGFDWWQQNKGQKKVKLRNKMIPMMFSLVFFILSLILFAFKDKMTIAMLVKMLSISIKTWLFGQN
ncbi:hypothetical protein FHR92_004341 [Fontibacillus solani]|uniref:Uncharacterized protein n=1 Tax=Fontibacillus solani TaxID=1572857 RepID=A0A7W3SXP2_9BACL|nr:hypothetical protein [Fontibacillus solani]